MNSSLWLARWSETRATSTARDIPGTETITTGDCIKYVFYQFFSLDQHSLFLTNCSMVMMDPSREWGFLRTTRRHNGEGWVYLTVSCWNIFLSSQRSIACLRWHGPWYLSAYTTSPTMLQILYSWCLLNLTIQFQSHSETKTLNCNNSAIMWFTTLFIPLTNFLFRLVQKRKMNSIFQSFALWTYEKW